MRRGTWCQCEVATWPDNRSGDRILAWTWDAGDERLLVAVNWAGSNSQARIRVPWNDLRGRGVTLTDALSGDSFERAGDELAAEGLYVDLGAWSYHVLRTEAARG